jgi:Ribbon-helix-helix protein, copG family
MQYARPQRIGSSTRSDLVAGEQMPYLMPYTFSNMRKTSVYLDEDQAQRLARLAREEGRSQAEVLREAVATYQPKPSQDRNFTLAGSGHGDGSSITDVPEEDLLKGFGE